jgi:hypothetical protein
LKKRTLNLSSKLWGIQRIDKLLKHLLFETAQIESKTLSKEKAKPFEKPSFLPLLFPPLQAGKDILKESGPGLF